MQDCAAICESTENAGLDADECRRRVRKEQIMTIQEVDNGGNLQLDVEGKIDSLTCQNFQDTILKTFQKTNNLVINMEKVDYVSSAGLRALILGQKTASSKGGSMVIINASSSVKDVFRVTGFDKVLDIR